MPTFRIPTPLRPYAGGLLQITVTGETVGRALADLIGQYPDLRQHLFDGPDLRAFVNIFLNQEDIRFGRGLDTTLRPDDTLLIIPSIAGGAVRSGGFSRQTAEAEPRGMVDQSALRLNQASIITLTSLAFILNSWPLLAGVALVLLLGAASPSLALFKQLYQRLLRPAGLIKPDVIPDNPAPHRFAQGLGGAFLALAVAALLLGWPGPGWALAGVVVALAALNLFLGFCAGCFLYYQFNRWGVPGFARRPIKEPGQ